VELLPVSVPDECTNGTSQIFQTQILPTCCRFVHDSRKSTILLVWLVQDTPIVSDVNESVKTSLVDLIQPWAIAASLVGSWAIFIGAIRIIATIQLRWETKNLLLMGTSGVLLIISGILLWLPSFTSWRLLGFLALASGITLIAVALRVRDREEWDSRVRYRRV
jgi:hypothetical protein